MFRRFLDPAENEAPLPVVEPPAYIPALPERGGRLGRRIARNRGNGRVVQENLPLPGRAERHRRRQQLIDAERRNNGEIVEQLQHIPNLHQPALQHGLLYLRTGLFGLSYVGHVKFFPVESESKFKNSYCFT